MANTGVAQSAALVGERRCAFAAHQRYFHFSDISSPSWVLNAYNIAFGRLVRWGAGLPTLGAGADERISLCQR